MKERAETGLNLGFLNNYALEDEIYLQLDKLQALCTAQTILDSSEATIPRNVRGHYAMVVEEQIAKLRNLIDQLFI